MAEPYVGQIIAVGFNFAPEGWLLCNGQLLPISQYDVLYSLIGTTYGGDGVSTFALPDLQGRVALGSGQGAGLGNYVIGQKAGTENVTVATANMPAHSHTVQAVTAGTSAAPASTLIFGGSTGTAKVFGGSASSTTALAPSVISTAPGGGQGHENRQPLQTINYIIAWAGVYPQQA